MRRLITYVLSLYTVATAVGANVSLDLDYLYGGGSENTEIFIGDSVTWQNNSDFSAHVESYTGEWRSSILFPSESYSYRFRKPGRYIYRLTSYNRANPPEPFGTNIASVVVRPLTGPRPAVSIVSPPDNFFVTFQPFPEAVVADSQQAIVAVNFFRDGEFVAAATNPPYRVGVPAPPGPHRIWAESVDVSGRTNTSPPITITYTGGRNRTFNPALIPNVGFVFNYATSNGNKAQVYSSDDLKTPARDWSPFYDALKGQGLILILQTNLHHAFFYVVGGPT